MNAALHGRNAFRAYPASLYVPFSAVSICDSFHFKHALQLAKSGCDGEKRPPTIQLRHRYEAVLVLIDGSS